MHTPPSIPDTYLEKFPVIFGIIASIRDYKRYKLLIKDCSLGSGFPVIASVLIDQEKHTYIACEAFDRCAYPETERLLMRLKEFHEKNPMNQQALADLFHEVLGTGR